LVKRQRVITLGAHCEAAIRTKISWMTVAGGDGIFVPVRI
jgi:hypothetical protein